MDRKQTKRKKAKFSDVISIVAHQLKTPISVLYGYLEVLASEELGKLNKKQKEYLLDARKNVEVISNIVKDLLDVSKIEEGKYKLNPQQVNLVKICEEVIASFASWARASNCEIVFKKPSVDVKAYVDPSKIRYVIENLISNAITYKSLGPARVEIGITKKGNNILFSCKDNGIGISKTDAAKIFSKFYRSEEAVILNPSGTGLGLYISKAIVELSGGKIWFRRNRDKGTTFYFTVPATHYVRKKKAKTKNIDDRG
ncbi:HAMP domain-containing histidine kinase [bacterium]|nr:HAMP domain-containing histidine kinase [bacterium]